MECLAASGPLAGVTVLDFTRILSGPYCTLLLADLGAQVIKVERAGRGDETRGWGPPFLDADNAISTYFAALNRGKRSLALDFRAEGAATVVAALCARADVVIENFRPGVAAQLGVDFDALHAARPDVVTCSISGFGALHRYRSVPATEIVVEALSGLMHITGSADSDPARFGIAMIDIATGLTAAARITASLMNVQRGGRGEHIDCSLYAMAVASLGTLIAAYSAEGREPTRWGSGHPSIVPYRGFTTADGYVITGVLNDAQWPAFCEAMNVEELLDDQRYRTNAGRVVARVEVEQCIEQRSREHPTEYWLERLRERDLLAAPVRTVGQAVEEMLAEGDPFLLGLEGFPGVHTPRLAEARGHDESSPQRVPLLGGDSWEILTQWLGMSAPTAKRLVNSGVVAAPDSDQGGRPAAVQG